MKSKNTNQDQATPAEHAPRNTADDNGTQTHPDATAIRAYYLWEAAGSPDGRDDEFWLCAKEELSAESKA